MTTKGHLEEFMETITTALSQKLVTAFSETHRDPSLTEADVITRLKEQMEATLGEDKDAAS